MELNTRQGNVCEVFPVLRLNIFLCSGCTARALLLATQFANENMLHYLRLTAALSPQSQIRIQTVKP